MCIIVLLWGLFQSLEQHADSEILLARYDFLLVLYSFDLESLLLRYKILNTQQQEEDCCRYIYRAAFATQRG